MYDGNPGEIDFGSSYGESTAVPVKIPHNALKTFSWVCLISEFRVSETARSWARIRDKKQLYP